MAQKRQVWIHGTSVQVEYPGNLESFTRKGWGTMATGKHLSRNWFHFSIPTPSLIEGSLPILQKVHVLYNASGFLLGGIQNVHIYDGSKKIFSFDDLEYYTGDHSTQIDERNTWDVNGRNRPIRFGLGISVGVYFTPASPEGGISQLTFATAGAEFLYENTPTRHP